MHSLEWKLWCLVKIVSTELGAFDGVYSYHRRKEPTMTIGAIHPEGLSHWRYRRLGLRIESYNRCKCLVFVSTPSHCTGWLHTFRPMIKRAEMPNLIHNLSK